MRKIVKFAFVIMCFCILLANIVFADTRLVPAEYETIQSAVDASMTGDTVLVSSGIYNETINLSRKEILVKSTDGASQTIIDAGDRVYRWIDFYNTEPSKAVLDGFTLINGYWIKGNSAAAFINCEFKNSRFGLDDETQRCFVDASQKTPLSDSSPIDQGGSGAEVFINLLRGGEAQEIPLETRGNLLTENAPKILNTLSAIYLQRFGKDLGEQVIIGDHRKHGGDVPLEYRNTMDGDSSIDSKSITMIESDLQKTTALFREPALMRDNRTYGDTFAFGIGCLIDAAVWMTASECASISCSFLKFRPEPGDAMSSKRNNAEIDEDARVDAQDLAEALAYWSKSQ